MTTITPPSGLPELQEMKLKQLLDLAGRVYARVIQEGPQDIGGALAAIRHLESLGIVPTEPRSTNDAILYLFKYPSAIFAVATNQEKRELVGITLENMTLKDRKLGASPAAPFVFTPKAPSPYGMLAEELLKKPDRTPPSDASLVQPELDL